MPPKVLQYESPDQRPYKVELCLTEEEAVLFRHLLGCWDGQDRCDHREKVEAFARIVRGLADNAGFPY